MVGVVGTKYIRIFAIGLLLMQTSIDQNFVAVVDDKHIFIGLIKTID